jgi:hypothetical protein
MTTNLYSSSGAVIIANKSCPAFERAAINKAGGVPWKT